MFWLSIPMMVPPIPVPALFPAKARTICGIDIREDAKITGITPAVFDTLVLLNQREQNKAFTPNLLVKNLEIPFEKAQEVINTIKKYGLIRTIMIEMDDSTQEVYSFQPDPAFCALLVFAREIIVQPDNYSFFSNGRTRPYLK